MHCKCAICFAWDSYRWCTGRKNIISRPCLLKIRCSLQTRAGGGGGQTLAQSCIYNHWAEEKKKVSQKQSSIKKIYQKQHKCRPFSSEILQIVCGGAVGCLRINYDPFWPLLQRAERCVNSVGAELVSRQYTVTVNYLLVAFKAINRWSQCSFLCSWICSLFCCANATIKLSFCWLVYGFLSSALLYAAGSIQDSLLLGSL